MSGRLVKVMANVKEKREQLLKRAKSLPTSRGCYLMKNSQGKIIYIGKAKNLRSRVVSYFGNSAKTPKTTILVGHIDDFEFILTQTEAEALVLENNLIKKHLPKYNIMLKDDKSYPYVVIDQNHSFPRPLYLRRFRPGKKIKVFGPFVTGSNILEILRILIKSFGLRDCNDREFNMRDKPCLRYQMQQCSAPCVGKISKEKYGKDLDAVINFFGGKSRDTLGLLEAQMERYGEEEQFEKALMIRDNLVLLKEFVEHAVQKCAMLSGREKNLDVVAFSESEDEIDVAIYMVRGGLLLGHRHFYFLDTKEQLIRELFDYYQQLNADAPEKIVTPFERKTANLLESALALEGKKYQILAVEKRFSDLFNLAQNFAYERQKYRKESQKEGQSALVKLKEILQLKNIPRRIEAVDIAVFQGKSPTASVVCFIDGKAKKSEYRYYHLQEREEGNNDFAMMEELFSRRLRKENLPDLFVVDGGQGQLKAVKSIFDQLKISVPLVGIAKSRSESNFRAKEVSKSKERLVILGRSNSYDLSRFNPLFKLMVQLRDEAHRFCRKLHHRQEEKRMFTSWLEQVEGIGQKTKIKLLKQMDQTREELSLDDIEKICDNLNLGKELALRIVNAAKANLECE